MNLIRTKTPFPGRASPEKASELDDAPVCRKVPNCCGHPGFIVPPPLEAPSIAEWGRGVKRQGPGGAWGSFIWTAGDIGGWNGCVWVAFLGYEMVYFAVARTPKHLKLKSVAGV